MLHTNPSKMNLTEMVKISHVHINEPVLIFEMSPHSPT